MKNQQASSYRVAIVGGCLSSHGGGMPRSMAQQARNLVENGCTVTLFTGFNKMYPFTPAELETEAIPTYASRLWGPNLYGLPPGALIHLWKQAKEFDVIHLNAAWNLTTFAAGLIAHFRKTPYIITCRSHYGDYHFSRMPFLKKILFTLLERINIRNAYALHVTADWEKKTSWRAVQLAKRIIKIPNPVNLRDFENPPLRQESREQLSLNPDVFYIVHLGRLGKQKNLSFLLKAFHAVQGNRLELILIGPPEPKEKACLLQLAKSLDIGHQIRFIDFAKGRERCRWLAAANLFALPSHDENFCIAAIEAVATGTYCLLSPKVGAVEYMPTSMLTVLPATKPEEWASIIHEMADSPPPQNLSDSKWLEQFSREAITQKWIDIYAAMKLNN